MFRKHCYPHDSGSLIISHTLGHHHCGQHLAETAET